MQMSSTVIRQRRFSGGFLGLGSISRVVSNKNRPLGGRQAKRSALHRSLRQYYLVQVQRVRSQLPRERPFGVCNRLRQLHRDGEIPYSANLPPVIGLHRATDVNQPYNISVKQTSTLVWQKFSRQPNGTGSPSSHPGVQGKRLTILCQPLYCADRIISRLGGSSALIFDDRRSRYGNCCRQD